MGEALAKAIEQVVSAYPEMWPDGVAKMLDAIDTDTLQELHDERVLADLADSVHISQLLEVEERRLRALRVAREGRGGDPFAGFPKDGQP
jgi:hypothetical protein